MYQYCGKRGGHAGALAGVGAASGVAELRTREATAAVQATAGYPHFQAYFRNALSAATAGDVANAERFYRQGYQITNAALPGRIRPLQAIREPTGGSAPTGGADGSTLTKSIEETFAKIFTRATPTSQTAPPSDHLVDATGLPDAWMPEVAQGAEFLQRQIGPLKLWQWGVAAGGTVVALSLAAKVAKMAVLGGAVAGGALLAAKAGGVLK